MPDLKPTGHKTFDKIAANDYIGCGNVYSNIQYSGYIRAYNELECNGRINEPGHLQEFDLSPWRKNAGKLHTPHQIFQYVKEHAKDEKLILYAFFHTNSRKQRIVHGYAVTKAQKKDHKLMKYWVTGPTYKSHDIVAECVRIVGGAA